MMGHKICLNGKKWIIIRTLALFRLLIWNTVVFSVSFSVAVLLLSDQTCSTTNHVTYTRDSTASDETLLLGKINGQTKYEMNINLSSSSSLPVYCNDYRNIQGHEGMCIAFKATAMTFYIGTDVT